MERRFDLMSHKKVADAVSFFAFTVYPGICAVVYLFLGLITTGESLLIPVASLYLVVAIVSWRVLALESKVESLQQWIEGIEDKIAE
jgi:hypothetical protein